MARRALVVIVLLLATGAYGSRAGSAETMVSREPLASLPLQLGDWQGYEAAPFAGDLLAELGVDDHLNRQYIRQGSGPVGVYVGYYASQRQGDTIHSPQNCLPGAGWQPVESGVVQVPVEGRSLLVNQYVIQRGLDKQVVLYWYQGRGRVIANEYHNKAYLMLDSVRLRRTNGGLVRLIAPIATTADAAKATASSFARVMFPHLAKHLP